MKQNSANRKINEQAREIIANTLLFDVADPRFNLVTITACEVSRDRSVCNVFYTAEPDRYDEVEEAFSQAKGCIRSIMARELSWRIVPELRFKLDSSLDLGERVDAAIEQGRTRNASQETSPDPYFDEYFNENDEQPSDADAAFDASPKKS